MSSFVRIAVDFMSGDLGPHNNLDAIKQFLSNTHNAHVHLCGDETLVKSFFSNKQLERITTHHSDHTIAPDLKPSAAIRLKTKTSLHMALELLKTHEAEIVLSSANTGAYMALCIKTIGLEADVRRPAIGKVVPSLKENSPSNETLLLDIGANINCTSDMLCDFASIGQKYMQRVYGKFNPSIALLNIGSEAGKGTDAIQQAASKLTEAEHINFVGFVEGDDLLRGAADVIVCDGFHGNIAIKVMEGTIHSFYQILKSTLNQQTIMSQLGKLLIGSSVKTTFGKTYNPKRYNGALLMGLNGQVMKSHGGADSEAFYYALETAYNIASSNQTLST